MGHTAGHGGGHGHKPDSRHDTDVKSMVLETRSCLGMPKFTQFLQNIIDERSVDLYRYKGVLAVRRAATQHKQEAILLYILQGVHDMPELTFSSEWPTSKEVKTQVVLIGHKLDPDRYRKEFALCKDDS